MSDKEILKHIRQELTATSAYAARVTGDKKEVNKLLKEVEIILDDLRKKLFDLE